MTDSPRDLDRTLQAFLDAGPDQMSDRLATAIRTDVQRTRQRGSLAPWRFPHMSRFTLFGATAVIAVAVVALALVMTRPVPNVGTSTSPSPSPTSQASLDYVHRTALGTLVAGDTYVASLFSEPFRITVPHASQGSGFDGLQGDMLDAPRILRIRPQAGALTFQDDDIVPKNYCQHSDDVLTDIPATSAAVERWLKGMAGVSVSSRKELTVDGRTAFAWDIALAADCGASDSGATTIYLSRKEHHRIYAIPTGKDTILAITWGSGYEGEGEQQLPAVNAWADEFIKAMHFE